jgi:hypothetical protein
VLSRCRTFADNSDPDDVFRMMALDDLSGSMLEVEESILRSLNKAGTAATGEALKRFDADSDAIMVG